MLPVYTRFLTPADYGILELVYMTINIISIVIGLRIEACVGRFYFDYKDQADRNKVISTAFIGYGGMGGLLVLCLLPFSSILAEQVLDSAEHAPLFIVALLNLGLGMVSPIGLAYFRVTLQSFTLLTFSVVRTILTLGLNIYFVVIIEKGVMGILLATLITSIIINVAMVVRIMSRTGWRIDFGILWQMVKFGAPLVPAGLAGQIFHVSDRYFVKEYISMGQAGLYSLGYKIGSLVHQFITTPFQQVWTPRRFENFNKEGSERNYARIFTYFVTLGLFMGLMISLLSKEIIRLMTTEAFWSAYKVVPIIALAHVIFSFQSHFSIGILMKKATKYLAMIDVTTAIINLILNVILIRKYGIWGAAVATLICLSFKVGLTYYYSNKFYPVGVEWRRVATLFTVTITMYFVIIQIDTSQIWLDIVFKALAGCSFPFILLLVRFFTREELKTLVRIVVKRDFKLNGSDSG